MSYFDFPHTRNYDTDLGYIIKKLQEVETTVNEFSSINEITYHDPIKWDITTQYTRNTIVVDGYNTYLSKQPVPAGVDISNDNYWLKVADFRGYIEDYKHFITTTDLGNSDITLNKLITNNLIIYNDKLYKVINDIEADTKVIIGTNIEAIDVNKWVLDFINDLTTKINLANVEIESNKALINSNTDSIVKNETAINNNTTSINTLNSKVDSEVNDIHNMINDNETLINNNTTSINNINNKLNTQYIKHYKYIFLGDSYDKTLSGWINSVASNLGISSNNYYNLSQSGTGFTTPTTWLSILQTWVYNHNTELNDITDIIIGGGANDSLLSTIQGLSSAITTFCDYVKNNLPNAHIKLGYIANELSTGTVLQTDYNTRQYCIYLYKNNIIKNGEYLNGTEYSLYKTSMLSSDGLHPSQEGLNSIIINMTNAINNGYCTLIDHNIISSQVQLSNCSLTYGYTQYINNNVYQLIIGNIITNSLTFNGSFTDLGELSNLFINNTRDFKVTLLKPSGGTISGTCVIQNKHLKIRLSELDNGAYASYTGVLWIENLDIQNILFTYLY